MKIPEELVGCAVRRTAFDFQVRLELVDEPEDDEPRVDAELVVETSFRLRDAEGRCHDLRPATGAALAPVLDLFGHTVTAVRLRSGSLALTFDNGAELSVWPDPAYESWWLTGHGIEPILVGPGESN
ncbi:DUF6188 family protein [Amycolatopsis sp. NBC_00348]|uniref:DUF6188 family protein n=1 Tax=Amycolatopsis sp. NBC_00348 TaxID=2975956 RepID=UPI002E26B686